jgi:CRISPR-associated protein (TIGR02710 family)
MSTFLICSVGKTPGSVIASIKFWHPVRVCFVHTPDSKPDVAAVIIAGVDDRGLAMDAGRYDYCELANGDDLEACLEGLQHLTSDVQSWLDRDPQHRVIVDFTGGTKAMSAALALHARQWPCLYSYVAGARAPEGARHVVTGKEEIVHQSNPWNAIGYQAVDTYVILFDQLAFAAAARVAGEAKKRMTRDDRKAEMSVLELLAQAFDAWERFDHKGAVSAFRQVEKRANDLRGVLGRDRAERVLRDIRRFVPVLEQIRNAAAPARSHIADLLGNARRRANEGRYDDAVARLYRAIEAVAQVALRERHGIQSTAKVALDELPADLKQLWAPRATEGQVALGLQDAYALLAALGDTCGEAFQRTGLGGVRSPLSTRNQSILAHGFARVPTEIFDGLWVAALSLADLHDTALPVFPRLEAWHFTVVD